MLQVMKYCFSGQPELRHKCEQLLRVQPGSVIPEQLLEEMLQQVRDSGAPKGLTQCSLVWRAAGSLAGLC
jgi:hypothetical protein